jgi:hypothetical protein
MRVSELWAAAAMIADKGYDANHLHDKIVERGGELPPKRNRKVQRSYDDDLYSHRSSTWSRPHVGTTKNPAGLGC